MLKRPQIIIIVAIVVIVAGALAYVALTSSRGLDASAILGAVPDWAMEFGARDAPMVAIEFYDPLCPYCAVLHYRLHDEFERLIAEGRLRLVLLPLPVHGNSSLVIIDKLHCAYRHGVNALHVLNMWYSALIKYAVNKTEDDILAVAKQLESYRCNETLAMDRIMSMLQSFEKAGITIRGTPTLIVIKNDRIMVIEGARVEALKSILT